MSDKLSKGSINRKEGLDDEISDAESGSLLPVPAQGFEPDDSVTFKRVPTLWVIFFVLILVVVYETVLFISIHVDFFPADDDQEFLFKSVLHVILFALVYICGRYMYHFHRRARNQGYLEFYRSTKYLIELPITMTSLSNGVLILILCLWAPDDDYLGLTRLNFFQIIFSGEMFCIAPALILLLLKTIKFNQAKAPPDAAEDLLPAFEVSTNKKISGTLETGYNEEEHLDDMMEKQGDMIKYLKHQKKALSERILDLTERLKKYEENPQLFAPETPSKSQLDAEIRSELVENERKINKFQDEISRLKSQLEKSNLEKANFQKEAENNQLLYQKEKIAKETYIEETDKIIQELRLKAGESDD